MYLKFSRCSQTIIGIFILCCLWLFNIARIETMVTFADSALEEAQTDSLLVGIPLNSTVVEVETILQDADLGDLIVEKVWPEFGIALVNVSDQSASPIVAASTDAMQRLEAYRQALEQVSDIKYVEYNDLISIAPSANNISEEYLSGVIQSASHTLPDGTDNQDVVVALIDSGFGTDEVDPSDYPLWENQIELNGMPGVDDDNNGFIDDYHGHDWIDRDNLANDELGHGTEIGTALVDFVDQTTGNRNDVKLMPLRILGGDGKGEISDLVDALAYALRKNVRVANISLVSYYNSPPLAEAMKIAHSEGLLMSATDDNRFSSRVYWPAAYPETLGVRGVLRNNDSMNCHTDSEIDIAIFIEPDEQISTSATPRVTAIIALALGQNPELSIDEIRAAVRNEGSCEDGTDGVRTLEVEELVTILSEPTALPDANEPEAYELYLPLIAR